LRDFSDFFQKLVFFFKRWYNTTNEKYFLPARQKNPKLKIAKGNFKH